MTSKKDKKRVSLDIRTGEGDVPDFFRRNKDYLEKGSIYDLLEEYRKKRENRKKASSESKSKKGESEAVEDFIDYYKILKNLKKYKKKRNDRKKS